MLIQNLRGRDDYHGAASTAHTPDAIGDVLEDSSANICSIRRSFERENGQPHIRRRPETVAQPLARLGHRQSSYNQRRNGQERHLTKGSLLQAGNYLACVGRTKEWCRIETGQNYANPAWAK